MSSFADFLFAPRFSLAAMQRVLGVARRPVFTVTHRTRVRPANRRLPCHKGTTIPPGVEQHITRRAKKAKK